MAITSYSEKIKANISFNSANIEKIIEKPVLINEIADLVRSTII